MTTKAFIEKAIEGGWKTRPWHDVVAHGDKVKVYEGSPDDNKRFVHIHEILLDPAAWKAVGKVEGWRDNVCFACGQDKPCWCDTSDVFPKSNVIIGGWYFNMRGMIDALADGKTIAQYLEQL